MNIDTDNFVKIKIEITKDNLNTLIIDTGATVSLLKASNLKPGCRINKSKRLTLISSSDHESQTLGTAVTTIHFGDYFINHEFHIIDDVQSIYTDGLLGKDFLKNRCIVDYVNWMIYFSTDYGMISHPIEDNINGNYILSKRSEVVRRIAIPNLSEDSIILSQEIQPGVFCGNTIVSKRNQYVKFINTTDKDVAFEIKSFKPATESLHDYEQLRTKPYLTKDRIAKIHNKIHIENIPQIARNELECLITK